MSSERPSKSLSAAKLALAVKRLRAETPDIALLASEPLAIIGMSCRLPGEIETPEDFWQLLIEGRSTIREMPQHRWKPGPFLTQQLRLGGYLEDIRSFDADFFGIAPLEAESIDPQHRLLLESTWNALLDAGIPPESLSGTAAAIFVAVSNNDYARLQLQNVSSTTQCPGMGAAHCMASGRLAFLLNTNGPNAVIDTACSSSLVAAHLAGQSLRNREANIAIVSAANLKPLPEEVLSFARWGMLAKDGRCKTFDAKADGFVPGEGSGTIIIKRLSDALADGNRIRAVIRGSAINHDGRTTVLSAPNGLAQQAVIETALRNAQVIPQDVSFIETHGTGTPLGDPIEVEALRAVYDIPGSSTCMLGAVKTNIGHLEAAAGIAGLIKVILALENRSLPPNLNYEQLNPDINLTGSRFKLPSQVIPLPRQANPRVAGLSSFGMSGTNAHFLIEEAPHQSVSLSSDSATTYLLTLSAKNSSSLQKSAEQYAALLLREENRPQAICASAALHRSHLNYRLAVTGKTSHELVERLRTFVIDSSQPSVHHGVCNLSQTPRIAFVFSGQGSAWAGMGQSLLEKEPAALAAIKAIDESFIPLAKWSLIERLNASDLDQQLSRTDVAQPLIFAIQVALSAVLAKRGIIPTAVTGHSAGEVAAAYISGLLTLHDAVKVIYHRSRVMQQADHGWCMLTAAISAEEANELISQRESLTIASYNAPRSVVIAGKRGAVKGVQAELAANNIFHRLLNVDFAFHTAQMDNASKEFASVIGHIANNQQHTSFISSQTGRTIKAGELTGAYWAKGIREPVRFQLAIDNLIASGHNIFLELGPRPVLANDIQECARAAGIEPLNLATMRTSQSSNETLVDLIASLYVRGLDIHWAGVFPGRVPVEALPAYPWQRKSYWIDEIESSSLLRTSSPSTFTTTRERVWEKLESPFIEGDLFSTSPDLIVKWHNSYQFGNLPSIPISLWLSIAMDAVRHSHPDMFFQLTQMDLPNPSSSLANSSQIQIHATNEIVTMMQHRSNGWEKILVAHVVRTNDHSSLVSADYEFSIDPGKLQTWKTVCPHKVAVQDFYLALSRFGLSYGTPLQTVHELWVGPSMALSHLYLDISLVDTFPEHELHPTLIEGALQTVCAAIGLSLNTLYFPISLSLFENLSSANEVWAYATVTRLDDTVYADILVVDIWGNACARIGGLKLQKQVSDTLASLPITTNLRENLKTISSELERHQLLINHVIDCVRLSMKRDKSWTVAEDQPLHEVGLDSLMGITLRNLLSVSLGQELRSTFTFDHPTIASMTQYFETMLWASEPATLHESDLTRDEISI